MTFAFLAQPVLVVGAALLVDVPAAALSSLAVVASAVAFRVGLTAVAAIFSASVASVAFFFASFASVRRCFAAFLRFFAATVVNGRFLGRSGLI